MQNIHTNADYETYDTLEKKNLPINLSHFFKVFFP